MNRTRFPKEDHLPDWARRDNKVKKGARVEHVIRKCTKLAPLTEKKFTQKILQIIHKT